MMMKTAVALVLAALLVLLVTQPMVHVAGDAAADQACRETPFSLTVEQLANIMGGDCAFCAHYHEHIMAALEAADMACPQRAAAFLAQVRHETAALTRLYQPLDNGAGALHMLPNNFRKACKGIPALAAAFGSTFSFCETAATDPCACGQDAEAGHVVQLPEHAFETGTWWFMQGSNQVLLDPCGDLREDADLGLGASGSTSPTQQNPGTGFYKISTCIFGFAADIGREQRADYYNIAIAELDKLPPRAVISAPYTITNAEPVLFSVIWSESVTGFEPADCTTTSGSVQSVTPDPQFPTSRYTIAVTGISGTSVALSIAPNTVLDSVDIANAEASNQVTVAFDNVPPTVTLTNALLAAGTTITNVVPVPFTATFSEPVTLDSTAITASSGTVVDLLAAAGNTVFTFAVEAPSDGLLTVDVSAATDNAANAVASGGGTAAITVDSKAPSVTSLVPLGATPSNAIAAAPIVMRATFSEAVTLTAGDITATGATVSSLVATDDTNQVYDITAAPTADGTVTLAITAALDAAGNVLDVTSAATASVEFDSVPPTVTALTIDGHASNGNQQPPRLSAAPTMRATFSEPVTLLPTGISIQAAGTVTVAQLTPVEPDAQGLATIYTFSLTGLVAGSDGVVAVTLVTASDKAGNTPAQPAPPATEFVFDSTAPVATLASPQAETSSADAPSSASVISVTATFSEPVVVAADGSAVAAPHIAVTSGQVQNVAAVEELQVSFEVVDASDGELVVTLGGQGDAQLADVAGNLLSPASLTIHIDRTPPAVASLALAIEAGPSAAAGYANAVPVPLVATFSEPVTLSADDVTTSSGTAVVAAVATTAGLHNTVYSITLTDTAQGQVEVELVGTNIRDAATNAVAAGSSSNTQLSFVYDTVKPTVLTLASAEVASGSHTTATTIVLVATFSEPVQVLASALAASSGVLTTPGYDHASLVTEVELRVEGATDGELVIDVTGGVDAAGNALSAAGQWRAHVDSTQPKLVELVAAAATRNPSSTADVTFHATFSEPVLLTLVSCTSGTAQALAPVIVLVQAEEAAAAATLTKAWSFECAGVAEGDLRASVAAATDAAGNGLGAASLAMQSPPIAVDHTPPTATLTTATPSPTSATTIIVTATFSEPVQLAPTGISASHPGSSVEGLQSNPANTVYTFDVAGIGADAPTQVTISLQTATDAAGNAVVGTPQLRVDYDPTAPGLVLASLQTPVTNTLPIVMTALFSKPVELPLAGVSVSAPAVVQGLVAASGVSGNTAARYTFEVVGAEANQEVLITVSGAKDAAGAAVDETAATTIVYDPVAPSALSISTSTASPTASSTLTFVAAFSEAVTLRSGNGNGTTASVACASGMVHGLRPLTLIAPAAVWSFDCTGVDHGDMSASVVAAVDVAGNTLQEAITSAVTVVDHVAPRVQLTASATSPTSATAVTVTATFSEDALLTAADLQVDNGATVGSFNATSGAMYTFEVTGLGSNGDGATSIQVMGAVDAAGNALVVDAGATLVMVHDSTRPTLSLSCEAAPFTNKLPIKVTATFSEAVTMTEGQVSLTLSESSSGGSSMPSITNLTRIAAEVYHMDVTSVAPLAQLTVRILGAVDAAGNVQQVADEVSVVYDPVAPELVEFTTTMQEPITFRSIVVTASFSEGVYLSEASVACSSGTPTTPVPLAQGNITTATAAVTGDDAAQLSKPLWLVGCEAVADGTFSLTLSPTDAAGNLPVSLPVWGPVVVDASPPRARLTTSLPLLTASSSIPVVVAFTEPVLWLGIDQLSFTSGRPMDLHLLTPDAPGADADYPHAFEFVLQDAAEGELIVSLKNPETVLDASGNSLAADDVQVLRMTVDRSPPQPTLKLLQGGTVAGAATVTVRVEFTKPVHAGFGPGLEVSSGVVVVDVEAADQVGLAFDVSLYVTQPGPFSIRLVAGVTVGTELGLPNRASNLLEALFDPVPPELVSVSVNSNDFAAGDTLRLVVKLSEPPVPSSLLFSLDGSNHAPELLSVVDDSVVVVYTFGAGDARGTVLFELTMGDAAGHTVTLDSSSAQYPALTFGCSKCAEGLVQRMACTRTQDAVCAAAAPVLHPTVGSAPLAVSVYSPSRQVSAMRIVVTRQPLVTCDMAADANGADTWVVQSNSGSIVLPLHPAGAGFRETLRLIACAADASPSAVSVIDATVTEARSNEEVPFVRAMVTLRESITGSGGTGRITARGRVLLAEALASDLRMPSYRVRVLSEGESAKTPSGARRRLGGAVSRHAIMVFLAPLAGEKAIRGAGAGLVSDGDVLRQQLDTVLAEAAVAGSDGDASSLEIVKVLRSEGLALDGGEALALAQVWELGAAGGQGGASGGQGGSGGAGEDQLFGSFSTTLGYIFAGIGAAIILIVCGGLVWCCRVGKGGRPSSRDSLSSHSGKRLTVTTAGSQGYTSGDSHRRSSPVVPRVGSWIEASTPRGRRGRDRDRDRRRSRKSSTGRRRRSRSPRASKEDGRGHQRRRASQKKQQQASSDSWESAASQSLGSRQRDLQEHPSYLNMPELDDGSQHANPMAVVRGGGRSPPSSAGGSSMRTTLVVDPSGRLVTGREARVMARDGGRHHSKHKRKKSRDVARHAVPVVEAKQR